LPVFGIERLFGIDQSTPNAPTFTELEQAIEQVLRQHKELVQNEERATGKRFFPHSPVAGVLLNTAIYPWDKGGLFSVSQLRLFFTGPEHAEISQRIRTTLSSTIEFT
jgi:hypothetical protein